MNNDTYIPQKLMRASEVAQYLNISRAFAYKLMQTGQLRTVQIGQSVRVRPEDLEQYIQKNVSGEA